MPQPRCREFLWAIPVIFLTLTWSLPAPASVTCAVRRHGQFVCTYFCQDGFVCDVANNRCNPGPELQRKTAEMQQTSRQRTLAYNHYRAANDAQSSNQVSGYGNNSVVYYWNGDPREIPSPHYRSSGGYSSIPGNSGSSQRSGAPVKRYTVRRPVRDRLEVLISAARSFAPDDPNRSDAVKLLRRYVRDNKVPIDVDELLNCGKPGNNKPDDDKSANAPPSFQLHWTVPDIESEIDKRGLCKQAAGDEARQACEAYQFGQVVMAVEPELRAICKLQENDFQEKDPESLGACAEAKFRTAWASRAGKVPLALSDGIASADAKKCPEIGTAENLDDLRHRLARALANANVADDDGTEDPGPRVEETKPAPKPDPVPEAKADSDDDDPFCAFIARRAVRGELKAGGGDKIPDYCRKAMDAAKSCDEQHCSMADIIDRQEHNNARDRMPWGAEDYQGIEKALGK